MTTINEESFGSHPWIYKVIKTPNPNYDELVESYKDKPEFLEDIPREVYYIGEVTFKDIRPEGKMTPEEIMENITNWTLRPVQLDFFDGEASAIEELETILEDLKKYPGVLDTEKFLNEHDQHEGETN